MIYLTSPNESDFIILDSLICANLGIPNQSGTTKFLEAKKVANQELWVTAKITLWAGNHNEEFTEQQIYHGIDLSKFTEANYNPNWFPE